MYIKKTDKFLDGEQNLLQLFKKDFNISLNSHIIVKKYHEKKIEKDDILLCEFLYSSVYATLEQLQQFYTAKTKRVLSEEVFESKLNKLVQEGILNQFIMSDGMDHEPDEIPKDALIVYCMDLGGAFLIQSFTMKGGLDWYTGLNLKCSGLVLKTLFSNELRLKIIDTVDTRLNYFRTNPKFIQGKTPIYPTFDFAIKHGSTIVKYMISTVFTEKDELHVPQTQIVNMENLLTTKTYKKYFPLETPPAFLIIGDTDYTILDIAKRVQATEIAKICRYTTEERLLSRGLDEKGAFLVFNPTSGKFQEVVASMFQN